MATELETGLPSVRQLQMLIRDKQEVEIKLMTSDVITGKVQWQDVYCVCLSDLENQSIVIWRHAIAYLKPKT
ncbi:MAG: RNA chaperone Hfq [Leptolyngbyaceae cyanobacterium MO_188.B28]|nr:RNA chaperone Hfq [Leptolyngbyaceae cyanobacterium MO_188.B28]